MSLSQAFDRNDLEVWFRAIHCDDLQVDHIGVDNMNVDAMIVETSLSMHGTLSLQPGADLHTLPGAEAVFDGPLTATGQTELFTVSVHDDLTVDQDVTVFGQAALGPVVAASLALSGAPAASSSTKALTRNQGTGAVEQKESSEGSSEPVWAWLAGGAGAATCTALYARQGARVSCAATVALAAPAVAGAATATLTLPIPPAAPFAAAAQLQGAATSDNNLGTTSLSISANPASSTALVSMNAIYPAPTVLSFSFIYGV